MAMTKAEVRRAFREVMAADYADVPAKEELHHTFSPEFYAKMDALIAEQKRGSWRLMSRQARRAVVAAVILALSMLLVACTPNLREAVAEFMVTVYESFVDFILPEQSNTMLRSEIETIYELNPVPEGFEKVSQEQGNPYSVKTVYMDESGNSIILRQFAPALSAGTADAEISSSFSTTILGSSVWISSAEDFHRATFFCDGYRFSLSYVGEIAQPEFERLAESLLLTYEKN